MRGEDFQLDQWQAGDRGSPPHARGRRHCRRSRQKALGITPACAGKTVWNGITAQFLGGSPPHARGRRPCRVWRLRGFRITPACAGKTHSRPRAFTMAGDHPRMRGEDVSWVSRPEIDSGSPPHARGRRIAPAITPPSLRITPACAGKTPQRDDPRTVSPDHPRMRGED